MRLRKLGEELALSPRHCFISVSVHGNLGQFLFSCVVISEVQLPGGKALATRPPEEQAGELSTFCKQAISVAQGTVLLCTAKNVGSLLCSVKFREEKVLSHTPPSLSPQQLSRALPQCPVATLRMMTRYFTMSSSKCKRFLKTTAGYFRESDTNQEKQKHAWHLHMEVINANLYCKFRAEVVRRDFPWCVHCCHLTCWVLSLKLDLEDDGKFLNPRTNTRLNAT